MGFSAGMNVPVSMDEIGLFEQGRLAKNFRRSSCGHHSTHLENKAIIGNVFNNIQVMDARDYGPGSPAQTDQEIDHLACAFGIE